MPDDILTHNLTPEVIMQRTTRKSTRRVTRRPDGTIVVRDIRPAPRRQSTKQAAVAAAIREG